LAASSNKKVLVSRFDRETLAGFVQTPGGFGTDAVELLTPEGSLLRIPYSETKLVCFVKDFETGDTLREHRAFLTRPKSAGLWVRVQFRDNDSIEGMLANNLALIESNGFSLVPPDPTFQNQRIFVPKAAVSEINVLGVIGSPLRRRLLKRVEKEPGQLDLFGQ
jgi:hypothetical protein